MKDGFLNINKPQNMTSFDVVAILRRELGVKKIGHLGTLDPMAEGVLPVAIGKATRLIEFLDKESKTYEATFLFGLRTDTDDIWGEPLADEPATDAIGEPVALNAGAVSAVNLTEEMLRRIIPEFTGTISQIPPKYSAIKVAGKKLYEYARAGQEVEIKSRDITVNKLELLEFRQGGRPAQNTNNSESDLGEFPTAKFLIDCSKGTYIRSIARDMGDRLGCGAVMSELTRTRSGAFLIEDAISLEAISERKGEIDAWILAMDEALPEMPKVLLGNWESKLFGNGVKLRENQWTPSDSGAKLYRVYGECAEFLGIGEVLSSGELAAAKVFR